MLKKFLVLILLLFPIVLMAKQKLENNFNYYIPTGYCVDSSNIRKSDFNIDGLEDIVLFAHKGRDGCKEPNNDLSVSGLFIVLKQLHERKYKVLVSSKKVLPNIEHNDEVAFDGLRDFTLNKDRLSIEIAKPNRSMKGAYSFIFFFHYDELKDTFKFKNYKINDLCFIPNENSCPRKRFIETENDHQKIISSLPLNLSLETFNTEDIFKKIFFKWQGIDQRGEFKRINSTLIININKNI